MIALVTGATGFIGYEVARLLAESGTEVRALVRRLNRGALLNPFDLERVVGDLSAPDSLRRACAGVDVVIHLAARATTFESAEVLRPTMVGGSLALLAAAADAGAGTFVYGSSLMVYGDIAHGEIDTGTPVAPHVDYGRVKVEAEQHLGALAAQRGVALGVVRLPHVYRAGLDGHRARGRRRERLLGHLLRHPAALLPASPGRPGARGSRRGRRRPAGARAVAAPRSAARHPRHGPLLHRPPAGAPRHAVVRSRTDAAIPDELVAYRWRHSVDDC